MPNILSNILPSVHLNYTSMNLNETIYDNILAILEIKWFPNESILLNSLYILSSRGRLEVILDLPESNLFKGHPTRHHNEDMF